MLREDRKGAQRGTEKAPVPQRVRIAALLEEHHRYLMTGKGSRRQITREIRRLVWLGDLSHDDAEVLRSALVPSEAEMRLERVAAGQDPDVVYDNPWKNMANLAAYVSWMAIVGSAIEFLIDGVRFPENVPLAIAAGLAC
jgi:hypothetical protein